MDARATRLRNGPDAVKLSGSRQSHTGRPQLPAAMRGTGLSSRDVHVDAARRKPSRRGEIVAATTFVAGEAFRDPATPGRHRGRSRCFADVRLLRPARGTAARGSHGRRHRRQHHRRPRRERRRRLARAARAAHRLARDRRGRQRRPHGGRARAPSALSTACRDEDHRAWRQRLCAACRRWRSSPIPIDVDAARANAKVAWIAAPQRTRSSC